VFWGQNYGLNKFLWCLTPIADNQNLDREGNKLPAIFFQKNHRWTIKEKKFNSLKLALMGLFFQFDPSQLALFIFAFFYLFF
jgi:hypothetical protein